MLNLYNERLHRPLTARQFEELSRLIADFEKLPPHLSTGNLFHIKKDLKKSPEDLIYLDLLALHRDYADAKKRVSQ